MKKRCSLILLVIALLGINAAIASADSGAAVSVKGGGVFVPLGHGVDH